MNKTGIGSNKNNAPMQTLDDFIELKQSRNDKCQNVSKEGFEDLSKLPKYRLLEMLDRQTKLLNNRLALAKLPDKGVKIKQSKKRIEDELEKRFSCNTNLCDVMAGLKLSVSQMNALEWTKDVENLKKANDEGNVESNDNPFKVLATHSGTVYSKKTIKIVEEQDQPLITDKDIEEIYAMRLCSKIDQIEPEQKFLPYKTLNHMFTSKRSSEQYKPQDLCAALQPPLKFGNVKTISLEKSVKLQYEQGQHLKEVQLKHAAERLKDRTFKIGNELPSFEKLGSYREKNSINSDDSGDEDNEQNANIDEIDEVHDDCIDEDREGVVTFQVSE